MSARGIPESSILEHMPLVKAIACDVHKTLPSFVEIGELVSAGSIGLMDAAARFDGQRRIPFAQYAKYRIRGAMLDWLRSLDHLSRDTRRDLRRVEQAATDLGSEATDETIASKMGISSAKVRALASVGSITLLQLSRPRRCHDDGNSTESAVAAYDRDPEESARLTELRTLLDIAKAELPTRWQYLLRAYYEDGKTMAQIGRDMGVNESRVSQLHTQAVTRLRSLLADAGITARADVTA